MSDKSMKVDMISTARDVQWSADTFLGYGSVKLVSPAKVNLFLGIGARREDGYHDAVNIMQATALHDVLYMNSTRIERDSADTAHFERLAGDEPYELPDYLAIGGPEDNLLVMIDCADKGGVGRLDVGAADNIVFKAIHHLACEVGYASKRKVSVRLEKNIPHQGGLGGGSSNAAAALLGAAKLWGIDAEDPAIEKVARGLGSDVAFFLHGGCALFDGTGENFVRALEPRKDAILLVKPEGGVSTAKAYAAFDEAPAGIDDELLSVAMEAGRAVDVPLYNNLTSAAEGLMPELAEIRAWAFGQEGVKDVLLCGSGATTCVLVEDFGTACGLVSAAQLKGWWARATMFSSLKAAIRPK